MNIKTHLLTSLLFCTGLGLCLEQDASAIIMRHDVDESEYAVDDTDYPALVDLFEPGDCIGTLVHEYYLLTVAHCAEDMSASQPLSVNGTVHAVHEILLHPDWSGWKYDIALVRFEDPVKGVAPHEIYRGDEEMGAQLTLVGRGVHGTGLEGEPGATQDTQLRRATNVVTDTNSHWIEVYFDSPDDKGVTDLEGVGASGDSGGPAFIETADGIFIAGLNSWGDADGSIRVGQYGAWDYSTRVSQYVDWLDEVLVDVDGEDPDDTDEPDDTADPDDTEEPDDGEGDSNEEDQEDDLDSDSGSGKLSEGCACSSTPTKMGWPVLVMLMGLIQRRRVEGDQ